MILFVSCRNAGGGRSQSRDTPPPVAGTRDSPVLGARDTPAAALRYPPTAEEEDTMPPQAITLAKRRPGPPLDTVMEIDLDGFSLEGTDVKAHYVRDTLRRAELEIFGETFNLVDSFSFSWDGKIRVKEKSSRYKVPMAAVKSDKDVVISRLVYLIDTNGVVVSGEKPGMGVGRIIESYTAFKKNVPMILKP